MSFRNLIGGGLSLVTFAALAYFLSTNVTVRAWLWRVENEATTMKSNEQLLAELKIHVADLSRDISRHELKLIKTQRLIKPMEDDLAACRTAHDEHVFQLGEARKALGSASGEIVVAGGAFVAKRSRADIEADVKLRLQRLADLKRDIRNNEKSLQELKSTQEKGDKVLKESLIVKNQKVAELESLDMRLKNAERLADIRSVTDDLKSSFASMKSTAFQKSWRELLDRVDAAEINFKSPPVLPDLIDYRETDNSENLVRAIDAAINAPKGAAK